MYLKWHVDYLADMHGLRRFSTPLSTERNNSAIVISMSKNRVTLSSYLKRLSRKKNRLWASASSRVSSNSKEKYKVICSKAVAGKN